MVQIFVQLLISIITPPGCGHWTVDSSDTSYKISPAKKGWGLRNLRRKIWSNFGRTRSSTWAPQVGAGHISLPGKRHMVCLKCYWSTCNTGSYKETLLVLSGPTCPDSKCHKQVSKLREGPGQGQIQRWIGKSRCLRREHRTPAPEGRREPQALLWHRQQRWSSEVFDLSVSWR